MASQPPALLLGGGVVALSAARGLNSGGVPVIALGHRSDPLRSSRACARFVDTGSGPAAQERWLAFLEEDGPRNGSILPCCDDGLELLARNRQPLVELGYAPMEANDDVLLAMLDKQSTAELARAARVDAPRTATVERGAPLDSALKGFEFPCGLKPRHSHRFANHFGMLRKLIVVESRQGLEAELAALPADLKMIATEIVPGPDRYCSYYSYLDESGEPLFHYTKEKLRQFPIHFGLGTYHVSNWNAEVAEAGLRFFQGVGVRGPACVEFKRDERDGRLKLIECNHRLTAADTLQRACGLELGLLAHRRALGLPTPQQGCFRRGVALWFITEDVRAMLAYRRSGELSIAGWIRSLRLPLRTPLFSFRDPIPSLIALTQKLCSGLRSRAGRRRGSVAARFG